MEDRKPVVVFDIGNVLIQWDPRHLYRTLFDDEARMEWFLDNICTMDWNLEQDRGRTWAEATALLSAQYPEWKDHIEAYDRRWSDMVPGPIAPNVAVLEALNAAGWPVYAITNFSAEKFAVARATYPFLNLFRGTIVSGEERLLKPEPAIYRLLCERYGLRAEDCVFLDDSPKNVAGAIAVGMAAIHVADKTDIAAALRRYAVPV